MLADLLHEVHRKVAEQMRGLLQGHEIPPTFMMIGRVLGAEPGITVSELARRTGIAKSHVSNTIDDLARRGWVEKRADPGDQRLLRLYLSRSATDNWTQIRASMRARLAELVAEIPEEKTAALIDGLQALKELLDRTPGKGPTE